MPLKLNKKNSVIQSILYFISFSTKLVTDIYDCFQKHFEETNTESNEDFNEPLYFQINNTNMKITKNYFQLHEIIKNIKNNENKSEIYKILIPNLIQNKIVTNDYDYDDYISYEDKYSSVTISNYDRQDIYQDH